MTKTDAKTKILQAALPDIAFDGWTDGMLERAAKKAKASSAKEFPNGVTDLVRHFSHWADTETLKVLAKSKKQDTRIRDKITAGVRTRLEILKPHKQAVSSSLAYMSRPPRNFILPKLVWATADALWDFAGDTSTDYNRYTKRILLSGVITATTLYWLNDTSHNSEDTWAFLDRRIENVLKVGQKISSFTHKKTA